MNCPHCNQINSHKGSFCMFCGTNLEGKCLNCGFINPEKANFCGGCGASRKNVRNTYLNLDTIPPSENLWMDNSGNLVIKTSNGVLIKISETGNFQIQSDVSSNLKYDYQVPKQCVDKQEPSINSLPTQKIIDEKPVQARSFEESFESSFEESVENSFEDSFENSFEDSFENSFDDSGENSDDEQFQEIPEENNYENNSQNYSSEMIDAYYNHPDEELSAFEGETTDPWEGDNEDITEETRKGKLLPLVEKPADLSDDYDDDDEDNGPSELIPQIEAVSLFDETFEEETEDFRIFDDPEPEFPVEEEEEIYSLCEMNFDSGDEVLYEYEEEVPTGEDFDRLVGIEEEIIETPYQENDSEFQEDEDLSLVESNTEFFRIQEPEEVKLPPITGKPKSPRIPEGMENQSLFVLDTGNNRVQKFALDGSYQLKFGNYGSGQESFNTPKKCSGYYENGNCRIVVSDFASGKIKFFDEFGNFIQEWSHAGEVQLNYPMGISCAHGRIYVVDTWNNRILVFFKDGNFAGNFGNAGEENGEFTSPNSIVCSDDYIFVSDGGNNRIQIFNKDFEFVKSFGKYGSSKDDFDTPSGMAIFEDKLYIADSGNNRVKMYDHSGNFLREFGVYGDSQGELDTPNGIAVDQSGNVFIADTWNNRIQIFNSEGEFLSVFGTPGKDDGQLNYPNDICVL